MKTAILMLVFAAGSFAACGNGYSYCRPLTFNHTLAGASDTANFPALLSGAYSYLATVANGGRVQQTVTQSGGTPLTVPADLIFTSDSACGTKLSWEFESYNPSTGAVNVWINIGTLSHSSDTTIWMCMGNASVLAWQGNVPATWDSNYVGIYHFADNNSTLSLADSTSYANNASGVNAPGLDLGEIGGAISSPNYYTYATIPDQTYNRLGGGSGTVAAWVKAASPGYSSTVVVKGSTGIDFGLTPTITGGQANGTITWGNVTQYVTFNLPLNTWNQFVMVSNAAANTLTLYLNGAAMANVTGWTGHTAYPGPVYLLSGWSGGNAFCGSLDEVRMSNAVRSADQVLAEYNNQSSPATFYTVGAELASSSPPPPPPSSSGVRRRILL